MTSTLLCFNLLSFYQAFGSPPAVAGQFDDVFEEKSDSFHEATAPVVAAQEDTSDFSALLDELDGKTSDLIPPNTATDTVVAQDNSDFLGYLAVLADPVLTPVGGQNNNLKRSRDEFENTKDSADNGISNSVTHTPPVAQSPGYESPVSLRKSPPGVFTTVLTPYIRLSALY